LLSIFIYNHWQTGREASHRPPLYRLLDHPPPESLWCRAPFRRRRSVIARARA